MTSSFVFHPHLKKKKTTATNQAWSTAAWLEYPTCLLLLQSHTNNDSWCFFHMSMESFAYCSLVFIKQWESKEQAEGKVIPGTKISDYFGWKLGFNPWMKSSEWTLVRVFVNGKPKQRKQDKLKCFTLCQFVLNLCEWWISLSQVV